MASICEHATGAIRGCSPAGHDFDRVYGIGRCADCDRWVMTARELRRARRHGYAGPNADGTYWALIPARLGGGLATDVELEA